MQIPIPNDWDEETWECLTIQWPKSVSWLGLFVGFVSQPGRGRFWDARTGSIVGVQSIGKEIFKRNYPFLLCEDFAGEHGLITPDACPTCGGGVFIVEDSDMGQVVTNVYIEEKELVVEFGQCCEKRYPFSQDAVAALTEGAIAGDDWPGGTEFTACGKAGALADLLFLVGSNCFDEVDNFPWQWVGHIKDDVPGVSLDAGYLTLAVVNALALVGTGVGATEMFGGDVLQDTTCKLLGHFAADYETPDDLKTVLHDTVQGMYGLDFRKIAFWGSVIEAIGTTEARNAALSGATDTDRNCDCQDVLDGETEPTAAGWYWSAKENEVCWPLPDDNSWVYPFNAYPCKHDVFGVAFQVDVITGSPERIKRSNDPAPGITHDVDMCNDNSDYLAWDTLHAQCSAPAFAELFPSGGAVNLSDAGGLWSNNPALPVADKNELALFTISTREDLGETAGVCLKNVRWLFNENSPSHS